MSVKRCSGRNASSYLKELGVDPDPYWTYFYRMPMDEAERDFREILDLPIEMRERDLIERMGLDGRALETNEPH